MKHQIEAASSSTCSMRETHHLLGRRDSPIRLFADQLKHVESIPPYTSFFLYIPFRLHFLFCVCGQGPPSQAIWGMINTTVSIFCAATFDNAVFRLCRGPWSSPSTQPWLLRKQPTLKLLSHVDIDHNRVCMSVQAT